jgi:prepilin-type N-terminal cleavage/methylation domain-containing protein
MKRDTSTSRRRRRGLGLIELMVSLAISSALLTAVGMAYAASSQAIEYNDQFFRASQAARVSVNQIMAEVRKCQSGVVDTDSVEITPSVGEKKLYAFDSASHRLTLTLPDQLTPPTYTLAHNVTSAQFYTDGQTISMTVTVKIGSNQVTLNGSAMPRRTVSYN